MNAPRRLATVRTLLAAPTPDDAREVFERYASDADVVRFMSFPRHVTLDDTRAFIEFSEREWTEAGYGPYLIRDRTNGVLLGSTGLHRREQPSLVATGYILARDSWGRGFATEACRTMVDLASAMEFAAVEAPCHPENIASQRVLLKAGFEITSTRKHSFPNLGTAVIETPVFARNLRP